ncbi:MAG: YceI family protein, partial [Polyangiaceae bacterium]
VPVPAGATRFTLESGKGSFLIDAPLEKIKGMSDEVTGYLDANTKEIGKSTGVIKVRLSTLKTSTFGDSDKDVAQTEHARNWMEVGNDSSADTRMKYEWATFNVTSVDTSTASLAAAPEADGAKTVVAKVSGDVTIHGVTSKVTVPVTLTFKGPADAPTELDIKTTEPMAVSMKEHDVKPRDKIGGFLNGALDRIGKKIDDKVQVSFEGTSKTSMPKQP